MLRLCYVCAYYTIFVYLYLYIMVARTHSRTSTTSSEEVTYTFGGRDSPHSTSPLEGAYQSYRKAAEKQKKGRRQANLPVKPTRKCNWRNYVLIESLYLLTVYHCVWQNVLHQHVLHKHVLHKHAPVGNFTKLWDFKNKNNFKWFFPSMMNRDYNINSGVFVV